VGTANLASVDGRSQGGNTARAAPTIRLQLRLSQRTVMFRSGSDHVVAIVPIQVTGRSSKSLHPGLSAHVALILSPTLKPRHAASNAVTLASTKVAGDAAVLWSWVSDAEMVA
jgi:hypothetical protein